MSEAFLVVGLLLGSAFFAASELAITMSHRARVRTLTEQGSLMARLALMLVRHPQGAIALCLVGNNLANVGVAVFGRHLLLQLWSLSEIAADALTMFLVVPLVLVLGEVVPKALSQRNPERLLVWVSVPLVLVGVLLLPALLLAILVAQSVRLLFRLRSRPLAFASREELKNVLAHSVSGGHVDVGERDLIHQIVEFWKMDWSPLVRPLTLIDALPDDSSMRQVKEHMRTKRLARMPIVNAAGDDVVGVLTAPRLLAAGSEVRIQRYFQAPVRVQHDVNLAELMSLLQMSPSQVAVVHGPAGPPGVVFLDDLLGRLLEQPGTSA